MKEISARFQIKTTEDTVTFFELVSFLQRVASLLQDTVKARSRGDATAILPKDQTAELQQMCRENRISVSFFTERRFLPDEVPDVIRWPLGPFWNEAEATAEADITCVLMCNIRGEVVIVKTIIDIKKMPPDTSGITGHRPDAAEQSPEGDIGSHEDTLKFLKKMGLEDLNM